MVLWDPVLNPVKQTAPVGPRRAAALGRGWVRDGRVTVAAGARLSSPTLLSPSVWFRLKNTNCSVPLCRERELGTTRAK